MNFLMFCMKIYQGKEAVSINLKTSLCAICKVLSLENKNDQNVREISKRYSLPLERIDPMRPLPRSNYFLRAILKP